MDGDKKDSSVVDFLNGITETPEIFKEEPAEEVDIVEEEKEEKPVPFHKDPKVQRYVEKQIAKALEDVKPAERQFRQEVDDIKLPQSFVKLIGNDTEEKVQVLKDLSDYFGTLKGEAKQEFLREMKEQEQKQLEADRQAEEELDNYFDEIEETYNVDLSSNSANAKRMRTDFIEYVRKIAPKDESGEVKEFPDLVASFEEFQEKGKRVAPASRAKELASRGMTRSTETSGIPKYQVGKGDPWSQVSKYIDSLK